MILLCYHTEDDKLSSVAHVGMLCMCASTAQHFVGEKGVLLHGYRLAWTKLCLQKGVDVAARAVLSIAKHHVNLFPTPDSVSLTRYEK
jgi:hypothetical protein